MTNFKDSSEILELAEFYLKDELFKNTSRSSSRIINHIKTARSGISIDAAVTTYEYAISLTEIVSTSVVVAKFLVWLVAEFGRSGKIKINVFGFFKLVAGVYRLLGDLKKVKESVPTDK